IENPKSRGNCKSSSERTRKHSFSWGRRIKDEGEPLSRRANPEFCNQLSKFENADVAAVAAKNGLRGELMSSRQKLPDPSGAVSAGLSDHIRVDPTESD